MMVKMTPEEQVNELRRQVDILAERVNQLEKQAEIDNSGNQEWIDSLCKNLCAMEDALGFKNDAYDKQGKWVPTIGPWLERVRDLIAAEGELGDLKEAIMTLKSLPTVESRDAVILKLLSLVDL